MSVGGSEPQFNLERTAIKSDLLGGHKKLPKVQKIAQSGHTAGNDWHSIILVKYVSSFRAKMVIGKVAPIISLS